MSNSQPTPNARNVRYKTTGTGSVARPMQAKLEEQVSIADFSGNWSDAIARLQAIGGGNLFVPAGVWPFSGVLTIPQGVNIVGQGGGSAGFQSNFGSILRAANSTAQLRIDGRGGVSGWFVLDGNQLGGETEGGLFLTGLSVDRSFIGIQSVDSAGYGMSVHEAQNCTFMSMFSARSVGNGLTLNRGCGGNTFVRCQVAKAGRYNIEITETYGDGPYNEPEHNGFIHCIFERGSDDTGQHLGICRIDDGELNKFDSCIFSSSSLSDIVDDKAVVQISGGFTTFEDCRYNGGRNAEAETPKPVNCMSIESGSGVYLRGLNWFKNALVGLEYNGGFGTVEQLRESAVETLIGGTGDIQAIYSELSAALRVKTIGNRLARFQKDSDASPRIQLDAVDSKIQLGNGTDAPDVSLQRSIANRLELAEGDEFCPEVNGQKLGIAARQWRVYHESIPTDELPQPSASMDGVIIVEDTGDASTNLIIYGNNTRRRITGEAV